MSFEVPLRSPTPAPEIGPVIDQMIQVSAGRSEPPTWEEVDAYRRFVENTATAMESRDVQSSHRLYLGLMRILDDWWLMKERERRRVI